MYNLFRKRIFNKISSIILLIPITIYLAFPSVSLADEILPYPGYTRIIIMGDQMLSNVGVGQAQSFEEVIARRIRNTGHRKIQIINNTGRTDPTTLDGVKDIQKIMTYEPHIVIIELGLNDILQKKQLQDTYNNLETIIKSFQAKKIKVLLVGIKPPSDSGIIYHDKIPEIYKYLAYKYKTSFYPSLLEGVDGVEKFSLKDGGPNNLGVELIAQNITPLLVKLVEEVGVPK